MTSREDFEDQNDQETGDTPSGSKNYVTPEGHRALRDELDQLWRVERPKIVEMVSWAAGNGDRSENGDYIYGKKRLREIDRRVRFLRKRLESAEIVDSSQQTNRNRVFFGATVTYADEDDVEKTVTIVGTDEADMNKGKVSWVSPIARALLKTSVGDTVFIRTPSGIREVEIVGIEYPLASSNRG
jgi:transcription elongation factor GreB